MTSDFIDSLFKALRAPFLALRVATPSGALNCQAPLDNFRHTTKQCRIASLRMQWRAASSCDFELRSPISEPKKCVCRNSGVLAPSARKLLAMAIDRFFGVLSQRVTDGGEPNGLFQDGLFRGWSGSMLLLFPIQGFDVLLLTGYWHDLSGLKFSDGDPGD